LRGALSISGLVTRFDDAACARFGAALRLHADRLAQKLDSLAD
jgi:DNA-binding IclR family transcriptional regulator